MPIEMIQSIVAVYGLVLFASYALTAKIKFWKRLQTAASRFKYRWAYDLADGISKCQFCQHFHLSWIACIGYGIAAGFSWYLLAVPFVVTGLLTLVYRP